MFGLRGVNIFNPSFSSSYSEGGTDSSRSEQVSQYTELINDLKNSSEFIGCNIDLQPAIPGKAVTRQSRHLYPKISCDITDFYTKNQPDHATSEIVRSQGSQISHDIESSATSQKYYRTLFILRYNLFPAGNL